MADGSIVFDTRIDNEGAMKDLAKLKSKIKTLTNQIEIKSELKIPLAEQASKMAAQLDSAKASLEAMRSSSGQFTSAQIAEQEETVKTLQYEWSKVQSKVDGYELSIKKSKSEIDVLKQKAGEIEASMAAAGVNTEKMAAATKKASRNAMSFGKQLKFAFSSILLYGTLFQVYSKFIEWLGEVIKVNDEASNAIGRLKGSLLTLAQPILNVVIPAFTTLVNILADVINAIARVVSFIFGTTAQESANAAEGLYEEQEALEGVGSAAKEAQNQLAGFDEINKLSDTTSSGAGSSSVLDKIKPIFENFDTEIYKEKLDVITAYLSGALLALGAILAFSGANIPLGIALMAAGAIGLASVVALNWNNMPDSVRKALTDVFVILGSALLVIGAILAFSGANIPLGIGLMIAGAAALGAAIAINWNEIPDEVKKVVSGILEFLGISLLVIGTILALSGANIPLGLGLMVAGAAALAAAVAVNWEEMKGNIKSVITEITALLGASFLAVGAILAFSGVNIPIGIALIAIGALSLATAAALNWDYIVKQLKGEAGTITAIASAALLALGIILCFTGVGIPLGVALIAAGAAGLVTVTALNWDAILKKLKEVWNDIKSWWNTKVSKYFTADYWKDLGSNMLNGLWEGLKSLWKSVSSWVSEKVDWIANKFTGATSSVRSGTFGSTRSGSFGGSIRIQNIPRLAQGAVIPANREFLAVLGDQKTGTNVEAPLETIKQALMEAMQAGGMSGTTTVVVQLDGKEVARNTVKHVNNMTRQAGKPVLLF